MRFLTVVLSLLILTAAVAADLYAASFTGPVILQLPGFGQARPKVFIRAGAGQWQPAQYETQDGRLLFRLDPAKLGSGEIMLLVNPPAGLVMNDFAPPRLTGLKMDGKPQRTSSPLDLGNLPTPPCQFVATLADRDNPLKPQGWSATFDGATVPVSAATSGPRQVTLTLTLPQVEYGPHEIVFAAADNSPQSNIARQVIRFVYLDAGNVALASLGATVKVDSVFPGYESLVCLNDGVTALSGTSCGNDVTWAPLEVPADHWAEVTFPKPTTIKEVSLYWAAYTDVAHTARHFQIQVPEGPDGAAVPSGPVTWKAVYTSPAAGEQESRVTTARFDPVTVTRFRVFMPSGQGSTTRPNLLWLAEIKAR
jgi:hypothetical protein